MSYDHILIIGFGAPEKLEDVKPFLKTVAKGRNIPEERLDSVYHHYELIGGVSPYNQNVFEIAEKLKSETKLPVFVGMRNWRPFLKDTFQEISRKHLKKGLAIIFSPQRSIHGCYQYKENVREALLEAGARIEYTFRDRWFDHPQFIAAQTESVKKAAAESGFENPAFLFSAHSIPEESLAKCSLCNYEAEVRKGSELVAEACRLKKWRIVYQSRSGNPRQPWLGPDIIEETKRLIAAGEKEFIVIPIGFFCDNVEILYDLDYEVKQIIIDAGGGYFRADTVYHNPKTIQMFSFSLRPIYEKG